MPPRRSETPADKTIRLNIAALITNYQVTDPALLALHQRWQSARRMDPTKLRLSELGLAVGISEPQLYKKLQGQHAFTIGELQALAGFFGVTLDDITTEKKRSRGQPAKTTP
jgi:hypothetical protein